jgi:polyphosphate kinase
MHRNLDRRVEALVEIRDSSVKDALGRLLTFATDDSTSAWTLGADAIWTRATADAAGAPLRDYQQTLLRAAAKRASEAVAGPHA